MVRLTLAHVQRQAGMITEHNQGVVALKNMMLFLRRTMMYHPKEMWKQIITPPRWLYTIPPPLRGTGMIFHPNHPPPCRPLRPHRSKILHPPLPQKWCWHWILHQSLRQASISIMVQPHERKPATTTRNRPSNPCTPPQPRKKYLPRQKKDLLSTTPIGLSSMRI